MVQRRGRSYTEDSLGTVIAPLSPLVRGVG
jgi:hypothetical protein